ncbi:MAG: hypothetical protein E7K72_25225 [Roseomonas mucosa]|nr:hypothetical protein [Roseomonas mucosa]
MNFTLGGATLTVTLQDVILLAGLLGFGAERLAAWLRNRHAEALARIVGMAGRLGAEIVATLAALPAGADAATVKAALIARGVDELRQSYAGSVRIAKATPDVLAGMISREADKLAAPAAVAAAPEAVLQALDDVKEEATKARLAGTLLAPA